MSRSISIQRRRLGRVNQALPFSRWREKVPKAAENCSCIFGIPAIHGGQMRVALGAARFLMCHPHRRASRADLSRQRERWLVRRLNFH